MSRFLPVLCLFLFAAAASASDSASNDGPATKPDKTVAVAAAQESDVVAGAHPVAAPSHSSTPRTPRWHSLLPGMIR
jgi:hypothetical protein